MSAPISDSRPFITVTNLLCLGDVLEFSRSACRHADIACPSSIRVASVEPTPSELEMARLAEKNLQRPLIIRQRVVRATATMLAAMKIDPISIRHLISLNILCSEKDISGTRRFSMIS